MQTLKGEGSWITLKCIYKLRIKIFRKKIKTIKLGKTLGNK